MSIAVVVNSATGNTKSVADGIARRLEEAGGQVQLVSLTPATLDEAAQAVGDADAVALGFWCDKGSCTPVVEDLMARLGGKRVFLFGTAGFGGAPSYFDRILSAVSAKLPAEVEYLGGAMCQGKMGAAVRARYEAMQAEHPDDPKIQAMIDNFDAAATHPDEDDCAAIAAAARNALLG